MANDTDDPTHKQKAIYSLTEKAIALLPIVVQIGAWGTRWVPDAKKLDGAARKHLREIQEGGPRVWAKRMDELRAEHLRSQGPSMKRRSKLRSAPQRAVEAGRYR